MGPQEMLDRAEVKNKWQLTPLKDFKSPRLTERMWRTAVVVLLTSLIYEYLIPGNTAPSARLCSIVYKFLLTRIHSGYQCVCNIAYFPPLMWKRKSVMYFKDITEGGFCQEKSEHMFDLADEWYTTTKQNRILWKGSM